MIFSIREKINPQNVQPNQAMCTCTYKHRFTVGSPKLETSCEKLGLQTFPPLCCTIIVSSFCSRLIVNFTGDYETQPTYIHSYYSIVLRGHWKWLLIKPGIQDSEFYHWPIVCSIQKLNPQLIIYCNKIELP